MKEKTIMTKEMTETVNKNIELRKHTVWAMVIAVLAFLWYLYALAALAK